MRYLSCIDFSSGQSLFIFPPKRWKKIEGKEKRIVNSEREGGTREVDRKVIEGNFSL